MMQAFAPARRTLADLGWPQLLAALSQRCRSAYGRARAAELPFLPDAAAIELCWGRIFEAQALLRDDAALCDLGDESVEGPLRRAHKGAVLSGPELVNCAALLRAIDSTRNYFAARRPVCPRLHGLSDALPRRLALARELDGVLHPNGEVRDDATPHLYALMQRHNQLQQQARDRLEAYLRDPDFAPLLQDNYYSLRNGRFVLPIKASFQAKVPGIVHNASQTGQTLFVEPQALLGLGNQLSIVASLIAEERLRILTELSQELGGHCDTLLAAQARLAHIDTVFAQASLAISLQARPLRVGHDCFDLRQARHPLLVLAGGAVVASDISLPSPAHGLIISGPNAGGKTATLKTVGLCALMLRAGMLLPVGEGAAMPLFSQVLCAIGDAQDLSAGLSTFAAHVTDLNNTLRHAGDQALALIDEIATGTSPGEGAALGRAVLEGLVEAGTWVMCTTHLEELKATGICDSRFVNARMECDPETLQPTFALRLGRTGDSNALAMAERLGLPAAVARRARELLAGKGLLAQALDRIAAREADLDAALAAQKHDEARVAARRREHAAQMQGLDETLAEARRTGFAALQAELQAARDTAKKTLAHLQAMPSVRQAQRAQQSLDQASQQAAQEAAVPPPPTPSASRTPRVGDWVYVVPLGKVGKLAELDGERAVVTMGRMHLRQTLKNLRPSDAPPATDTAPASRGPRTAQTLHSLSAQCDVRGIRAAEARRLVLQHLEAMVQEGAAQMFVLHGLGTGALRRAVREELQLSPYVLELRDGRDIEGGSGVTVARLQ